MTAHRDDPHPDRSLVAAGVTLPNGFRAVEAVDPDGALELWLLDPAAGDDVPGGCACRGCAPHEQPGRPRPPVTCGRPRTDGRPCRAPVDRAGDSCGWHRPGDQDQQP